MKITNEVLAQYLSNKALIKELQEANEIISIAIKQNGGASTKDYTAVVEEKERQSVSGKREFDLKFGPNWLQRQGLLVISHYQTVVIVEKDKAA